MGYMRMQLPIYAPALTKPPLKLEYARVITS